MVKFNCIVDVVGKFLTYVNHVEETSMVPGHWWIWWPGDWTASHPPFCQMLPLFTLLCVLECEDDRPGNPHALPGELKGTVAWDFWSCVLFTKQPLLVQNIIFWIFSKIRQHFLSMAGTIFGFKCNNFRGKTEMEDLKGYSLYHYFRFIKRRDVREVLFFIIKILKTWLGTLLADSE